MERGAGGGGMSRRRRGNRNIHLHRHYHDHRTLTVTQPAQPPPVPLVRTMHNLVVNAPTHTNTRISNKTFTPTVTAVMQQQPVPVGQQNQADGLAKIITAALGALILGASFLANHGGSPRGRR